LIRELVTLLFDRFCRDDEQLKVSQIKKK